MIGYLKNFYIEKLIIMGKKAVVMKTDGF